MTAKKNTFQPVKSHSHIFQLSQNITQKCTIHRVMGPLELRMLLFIWWHIAEQNSSTYLNSLWCNIRENPSLRTRNPYYSDGIRNSNSAIASRRSHILGHHHCAAIVAIAAMSSANASESDLSTPPLLLLFHKRARYPFSLWHWWIGPERWRRKTENVTRINAGKIKNAHNERRPQNPWVGGGGGRRRGISEYFFLQKYAIREPWWDGKWGRGRGL